ncbi:MAG TPA: type II CAAX endopeptidase family protein [Anaerolineales bacterium]|nr:CPBP family intramembrane metalloprotease [Anaerolineales bacterium]HNQ93483.1 type II CAAX endopeptidase family protein [Anaerolineales bacterium]HNS60204.1 type II CAAX endopeptidase family protein [Anaerolineales bacterium]
MNYLLNERLKFDWKIVTITIVSTLLFMVDFYHRRFLFETLGHWFRVVLYLAIPLFFIIAVFWENPKEYGFGLGDWKAGFIITAIGILFMAPVIYFLGSDNASMQKYYQPYLNGLPWTTFLDLIGWEFIFRGWILFGYARKFGPEALWIQAVPFALMHNGKPEVETLSTIFGGFAFGWVVWRTKSFLYPFLIHWFIATFIIIVAAGGV